MASDRTLANLLLAIGRLNRILQHGAAQALEPVGLTVSQWTILHHLKEKETDTLTGIATAICHDIGALSRAAHILQQRRLIIATRMLRDRRSISLALSPSGSALLDSLNMSMNHRLQPALETVMGEPVLEALQRLGNTDLPM